MARVNPCCCSTPAPVPCPCTEPNPGIDVTLAWTDEDVTKTFLSVSWTNGETKTICPSVYVRTELDPTFSASASTELWRVGSFSGTKSVFLFGALASWRTTGTLPTEYVKRVRDTVIVRGLTPTVGSLKLTRYFDVISTSTLSKITQTANLSAQNLGNASTNFNDSANGCVEDNAFGQMSDTKGITYTWARTAACASRWGCA